MCDTNPFTAPFSFHSPKDDRLFKKDDRVLSQTRPRFLKRRSFLSYKLFVVIYTKECINLQIRKVHYIRHIIGTSTDWFSAWSDDGVKVTMVILLFVIFPIASRRVRPIHSFWRRQTSSFPNP